MTLEELLQNFTEAMQRENDGLWDAGAAIAMAIKTNAEKAPTPAEAKAKREALVGTFSEAGKCTTQRIKQLLAIFLAFDEGRSQEHSWSWHRAVYNAARRNRRPPLDVLEEAIDKGWGARELSDLGRSGMPICRVAGVCDTCGFKTTVFKQAVDAKEGVAGLMLYCPVCKAQNKDIRLGTLA